MTLTSNWWVNGLFLASTIFLWAYYKIKSIYSYFEKRGIPYVKPTFLLGSDVRGALGMDGIAISTDRIYKALDGKKIGGAFLGIVPTVFVREPGYIHKLLTAHFEHFHDRPFLIDETTNPTEGHLFFLKGNKWRFMRNKLTPAFTPIKLKFMYDEIVKCSDLLVAYLDKHANGNDIDLDETLAQFSTDVIGTTAFGLEPETLKNPKSKFREMGKRFFAPTFKNTFVFFLRFAFPRFVIAMKIRTTEKTISDYFVNLYKQVSEYRIKNSILRKDFVQISLELKQKGYIEADTLEVDDELSYNKKTLEKFEITENVLAAQSFVFYAAGYETTARNLHYLIYLLSLHKDIQDKAREEVRKVKLKYKEFSFEALKEMPYLENCIYESLRLFPPLPFLNRECAKECIFPDGTRIEKGVSIYIPIFSIHRDPNNFPEPEVFKPDRFESPPTPGTYLPFGEGPRMCIGKRFAMMEVKMTVAKLLDLYCFEKSPLTQTPIQFSTFVTLKPDNPLYVRMSKFKQQY